MGKINFFRATEEQYNSIASPDSNAIYFITDKGKIYVNGVCYSAANIQTEANYIDVKPDADGYLIVTAQTVPVSVQFNNKVYDLDDCILYKQNNEYKIDTKYFLVQANLSSYDGVYRVWKAGGKEGQVGSTGTGIINITEESSEQADGINQITITTSDGNFYTVHIKNGSQGPQGPIGPQGISGVLQSSYVDIEAQGDYLIVPNTYIPVAVEIQNNIYDIDQVLYQDTQSNTFKIYIPYYLAKHNIASYQGSFRVWFAGGPKGDTGQKGDKGDIGEQGPKGDTGQQGPKGDAGTNTYVLCLCQQSPASLFDGMIWVKGGTDTPKYITAVGGVDVLTEEPADVSSLANGTFIITNTEE